MDSFFDSPQALEEIQSLYRAKLDALCFPYEYQKVETSLGDTNIIMTGEEGKPPLVLLHGSNGCAPIAMEAFQGLVNDFRIYAIDVIGQPNLSAAIRPSMQDNSYGEWMYEILSRLHIWEAVLVGISFGGFISWKTLAFDDRRIAQAFLIAPAGIVNGNPIRAFRKVFLPLKLYHWRKKPKYVRQFLAELFTDEDEFAFSFLSQVFLHFDMDCSPIPLIKEEEAAAIKTSVTLIAADEDLLFPGRKLLARARKLFPSLEEAVLLHNSKHVPGRSANSRIVTLIKETCFRQTI